MRWRVHYKASFDIDIDAEDAAAARLEAIRLSEAGGLFELALQAHGSQLAWHHIKPSRELEDTSCKVPDARSD